MIELSNISTNKSDPQQGSDFILEEFLDEEEDSIQEMLIDDLMEKKYYIIFFS
ncbi:MAG: hypothetical protein KDH96_13020 [Candidatus Riesia sp.]|nr:hypothetical protein [Candidatus Riesia sp.]